MSKKDLSETDICDRYEVAKQKRNDIQKALVASATSHLEI